MYIECIDISPMVIIYVAAAIAIVAIFRTTSKGKDDKKGK